MHASVSKTRTCDLKCCPQGDQHSSVYERADCGSRDVSIPISFSRVLLEAHWFRVDIQGEGDPESHEGDTVTPGSPNSHHRVVPCVHHSHPQRELLVAQKLRDPWLFQKKNVSVFHLPKKKK